MVESFAPKFLLLWVSFTLKLSLGSSSCPSGWNPSGSNCYILRSSKKKWSSAESDCVKLVGHLATITSGSENAVVYSLRGNSSSSQDIWIGLNDKGDEGTFEWVDHDGTNTSYRKWYDGEPNGQPNDGDCVRMVSNGKWRDSSCSDEYYYVCQKPDVTLLPKCQSGWTPNGLSCYSRFTKRTKWDSAESDCKLRGGHLVSINSTSENSVVFSLRGTSSSKRSDIWIGLNDKDKKGSFVWIDGTRSSYTNWHSSEPDDSSDCVRMVSDGTWKDKSCFEKYQYVCEYQLTTPSIIQSTMNSSLIVTTIAATTGIQTKQPVATSRSVSTTTLPTQKLTPAPVTTPVTTKTAATTQKQPTTSATIDFFAKSYENATTASPDTASSLSSHNTQASTTLPLIPVTQFLASERAPTTAETGTGSASLVKQTSSKATTMYVGVGAAITVCGVLAVVVFLLVVWRRRKRIQSHLADGSTTFVNSTIDGATFSTRGSTEDAKLHSTTSVTSEQSETKMDTELVGEDGYLVCYFSNTGNKNKIEFRRTEAIPAVESNSLSPSVATSADQYDIPVATSARNHGKAPENHYEVLCPEREDKSQTNCAVQDHSGNETRMKAAELSNQYDDPSAVEGAEDEDTYWEPASTEEELYGQLESRKFRHIERRDVTDRKEIGSGEFGVVEKALWQTSRDEKIVVAVKTLSGTSGKEDNVKFLREATINGQFRHRNVVRLHGVVTVGSPLMLVLEFMSNGDLKGYLVKQRPEHSGEPCPAVLPATLLQMCRDIASGMEYLARKSFVHRDLAARNILLNEKLTCKIGDFGMARDVSDDNYYVTKGGKVPIRWCAPETWNYKKFSSASDVWSYGVLLYEIWSVGQRPFGAISNHKVMTKVESGYRLPPPPGCSRYFYHLMIDCWNPDSHERPSFGNILQRLTSSEKFLTTNGRREPAIVGNLGDELDVSR